MGLLSAVTVQGGLTSPPARLRLYNLLAILLALLVGPLLAIGCLFKPSWRRGLSSRLGFGWPVSEPVPTLWAHAASVGEIEGIGPLVERWHEEHPGGRVIVTALTATGCDVAATILPFAEVRAFPIDLPAIVSRVARRLGPDLFLFSENEIWPNLLTTLADMRVPTIQVSGRLSENAAQTLGRFPALAAGVLGGVTRFCVQGEDDRRRLMGLGVQPGRVVVTGSLKGDGRLAPSPAFLDDIAQMERPLIVAGSTHEGEERIVLAALRLLGGRAPAPFWVIAPRHPERFDSIGTMLEDASVKYVRRTRLAEGEARRSTLEAVDVMLLDTIGELAGCFSASTVSFIGGSLVPVGGHNLLEPARCGVPIVVGPHLETVQELADRLAAVGAATIVQDAAGLAQAISHRIEAGPDASAGDAARAVAEERAGSLSRTWSSVTEAAEAGRS